MAPFRSRDRRFFLSRLAFFFFCALFNFLVKLNCKKFVQYATHCDRFRDCTVRAKKKSALQQRRASGNVQGPHYSRVQQTAEWSKLLIAPRAETLHRPKKVPKASQVCLVLLGPGYGTEMGPPCPIAPPAVAWNRNFLQCWSITPVYRQKTFFSSGVPEGQNAPTRYPAVGLLKNLKKGYRKKEGSPRTTRAAKKLCGLLYGRVRSFYSRLLYGFPKRRAHAAQASRACFFL